jgi:hypothetical protein
VVVEELARMNGYGSLKDVKATPKRLWEGCFLWPAGIQRSSCHSHV